MNKSHANTIAAMTWAGVPRSCWGISTTGTGRAAYRDFALETVERKEKREIQTAAYMRYQDVDGVLDVELMAKEMVLAGVPTAYTTFAKLMRDLRVQEAHPDNEFQAGTVYSTGAIVLPAMPFASDYAETPQTGQYVETVEYLLGHVYEGGVLVVGGSHRVNKKDIGKWPPLFNRMILETAKIFEVK